MTGLVRKATLLSACGLLLAGGAMAGVPNAANSQTGCILLMDFMNSRNHPMGANAGACFASGIHIIVRDDGNMPVGGANVVVDLSTCDAVAGVGKVQLGIDPLAPSGNGSDDPDVTVLCAGKTASKNADTFGDVCFSLIGTTNVPNPGPLVTYVCAKIYADGQLLATKEVAINKYDLAVNGTIDSGDRTAVLDAEGDPIYHTFQDYDCNGAVNAGDRSLMLDAEGNSFNGVGVYTAGYCP